MTTKDTRKRSKDEPVQRRSSQLGLVDGRRFEDWPAWEGQGVPLRENCDLDNPRQRFLWMFTAPPGMRGAPLLLPIEYWEMVSFRQCVLGGGIVGEPGLVYIPPATVANPWTAAGEWANPGTPIPVRASLADQVRALPQAERAEVARVFSEHIGVEPERPDIPDGKYRVSELAKRLDLPVQELVDSLANFGLRVGPADLVARAVADRIVHHLGL